MALNTKTRGRRWSLIHLLIRFLGLTALLVGLAALGLLALGDVLASWDQFRATLMRQTDDRFARFCARLLVGSTAVAFLALCVEIAVLASVAAGRRSAFGLNALVQIVLALLLLLGINLISSRYYHNRFDLTRDHQFTLAQNIRDQLSQLKDEKDNETTIVVYQRDETFGHLDNKLDAYDNAAKRKVVERVYDLVDQLEQFGPRFHVVELDGKEDDYARKLDALTRDEDKKDDEGMEEKKALREAIEHAPENSIFFYSRGKVQRLSFNEFYQLDKKASKEADGGRGNLVLLYQGVEPFARRVLQIDQKRPRVGVLVVHELLTTQGQEETFTLAGVKKTLEARGFEVRDIILKKWGEMAPQPEPAVYTYDESKFESLQEELAGFDGEIKALEGELKDLAEVLKDWETASPEELTRKYAKQLDGGRVTEAVRKLNLPRIRQTQALQQFALDQNKQERANVAREMATLNVDQAAEQRRMTDLKAKLDRALAECDLVIVPRMTLRNVTIGHYIPNRVHRLDAAQTAAIKDYLKAGKPMLACFGPINEPPERMDPMSAAGPDDLEQLLESLGIRFGKQTVLFDAEKKSFAERRSGLLFASAKVDVPPVDFEATPRVGGLLAGIDEGDAVQRKPNPIRSSMRIATHSLGKDLSLPIRHPRPISYDTSRGKTLTYEPEFMMTSAASWGEDQPFPSRDHTPRFDPKKQGPFSIGVAVKTSLPADWFAEDRNGSPGDVRVAVIGNGEVFVGPDLTPAKEQLLLNTCNWLIGRGDLLPHDNLRQSYPRVHLSAPVAAWNPHVPRIWQWGMLLGLPILFAYLGLVVVMLRRVREETVSRRGAGR